MYTSPPPPQKKKKKKKKKKDPNKTKNNNKKNKDVLIKPSLTSILVFVFDLLNDISRLYEEHGLLPNIMLILFVFLLNSNSSVSPPWSPNLTFSLSSRRSEESFRYHVYTGRFGYRLGSLYRNPPPGYPWRLVGKGALDSSRCWTLWCRIFTEC